MTHTDKIKSKRSSQDGATGSGRRDGKLRRVTFTSYLKKQGQVGKMRNGRIRYRDSSERRCGDRRINDAQMKSRLTKSKVKTQNKLQKKKAVLHPK